MVDYDALTDYVQLGALTNYQKITKKVYGNYSSELDVSDLENGQYLISIGCLYLGYIYFTFGIIIKMNNIVTYFPIKENNMNITVSNTKLIESNGNYIHSANFFKVGWEL